MARAQGLVIVGAGLAGDAAAAEMRERGWTGQIVLVGDERVRPYDRPPLSKAALLSADAEDKSYLRSEDWYEKQGIELVLGDGCAAIAPESHEVRLASGRRLGYAKLLLATGARARRLDTLESGAFPVHYLRSMDDARALREAFQPGRRIAIVGGGVIGLEIAASAVQRGCAVTVVEGLDRVMARCVSPRISAYLLAVHGAQGAQIRCGARLADVQDRAGRLLFADGSDLAVDAVVAGIGATPNVELAEVCGLAVSDGIVVDRLTRTSDADIHAAGDVTRFEGRSGPIRAEHWRHAIEQAKVAARVMIGGADAYAEEPWIWSDQYDLNIQITGEAQGDTEVLRGRIEEHAFTLFHLSGGRIVGATSVNRAKHKRSIAALVAAQATIDPAQLADDRVDLKTLVAGLRREAA